MLAIRSRTLDLIVECFQKGLGIVLSECFIVLLCRMFVGSVKRLKIMRTSDANDLGPRFQGVHRTAACTRGRT
ncbi:hypothetical protein U9M48_021471 [Paspalum notatum var. saurae]|uniref:Auxin-responsive protein n=1 Tax=Paspalum notatum var. saurae TaxID=547442 RepID=A0AAQ3THL3_PASNO